MPTDEIIHETIKNILDTNEVVLFMKGTTQFPQCGFSARVVQILKSCDIQFKDINVMADDNLRKGIKIYADWPTIPQLYIQGEFVGGCDIVSEMYQSGDLQKLLNTAGISSTL